MAFDAAAEPTAKIAAEAGSCRCGAGHMAGDLIHTEAQCDERLAWIAASRFDIEAEKRRARGLVAAGLMSKRAYARAGLEL